MEEGREYIAMAAQLSSNGYYSNAFDLYLLAFDRNPELKALFETEFRNTLSLLNDLLIQQGRAEEAFVNFGQAVDTFPENIHIINDTGKYLFKYGFYMEAWCHFQKALKMDSGFVNAEKNLNSLKNLLVDRWHYRMLNDKTRNEAYCKAIHKTIIPYKDSILDLGAGTGLLSLYCLECEPMTLTACDASVQMVKIAECLFEDNGHDDVIIVNKMSTDIISYRDVAGKKSLLVTELFDAGLFGEHILQSLNHAYDHLLQISARVIPNKGEFFVIGAKCEELSLKYQLSLAAKAILNIPKHNNIHILTEQETYDAEDVYLFKNLQYMTEAKSVLKIDFNDRNDIQEKLNNSEPHDVELKVTENGDIDIIIGYFNLYLTDDITLTTDPRSVERADAWQQALFFDFIPLSVSKDKIITTKILLDKEKLTLVQSADNNIQRITAEALRFLNDFEYVTMIRKCLGMASVYLGQMTEMSQITIVDLSPFPLFGILMLKRGIQSVTCWARTEEDKVFLKMVLKANNIPLSKIKLLTGNDWTQSSFMNEKYHAVFCNVFDLCGDINNHMLGIANHLKNAHLLPGGLFMPASVSLVAQVVNSHWLDINNRVYDKNTSNYKIGRYINKYQVSQGFCIDHSCLEYTPLTEPVNLGKHGREVSGVVNVPIIRTGDANAIISWYKIEVMEGIGEMSTNKSNSFISGMVFLADPAIHMIEGKEAHILRCIDSDGSFKLLIDVAS